MDRVRSEPDSETPEPARCLYGMARSRRHDAVRTAAGKRPRTRGYCQRRLDLIRATAPGTRNRSWPLSQRRVLTGLARD